MKSVLKASTALAGLLAVMVPSQSLSAQDDDGSATLEEISVTGSYIRRKSQTDTASPIQVVGSEELRQAGVNTISDLTSQLTINAGAQNNPDAFTQNVSTGTSNINLRGLGVASTLVLLNGKRTVTSGAQTDGGVSFVDTASLIPPIAIGQVEILKDGAGPLYGSDAVAGVVNFKTRSDFEGFETTAEIRHITDSDQRDITIGALFGHQGERLNMMAAFNYMDRNNLSQRDRDLRSPEALAQQISISTQTGYPGTFLLPSAPIGNLTDTLAFLTLYDQVAPQFQNPLTQLGIPGFDTFANPTPGLPLPPELTALGITTNSAPAFFPFPAGVPDGMGGFLPGAVFTGSVAPDANAGQGLINIPAATAFALGLGDGTNAIAIGADGIADALQGTVYETVLGNPALLQGFAAGAGLPAGFPLAFDPAASPGNVAGAALPIFSDPSCGAVAAQFEDVIPLEQTFTNPLDGTTTQVGACGYDFNNQFDLVPAQERLQWYGEASYLLGDTTEAYVNFGYARNRALRGNSNFPITAPVPIAANNPFNTFRSDVLWLGRSAGGNFTTDPLNPNPSEHNSDTWRLEGGLKGDIGESGWYYDVSYIRAENDFELRASDGIRDRLFLALQGLGGPNCSGNTPGQNGCEFFNPFGTGLIADASERAPLLNADLTPILDGNGAPLTVGVRNSNELVDWLQGVVAIDIESTITVIDAVVTGDLFELPAGTVGAAFGFQYRDERLSYDYDGITNASNFLFVQGADDFNNSRDTFAFFGEVLVPVTEDLELSAALRFEDYGESIGSTVDPKFSILWNASETISLRGTYSQSFRAPSVFQQFGNQTSLAAVRDPRTGGQPFIAIRTTGQQDLNPETADTITAGITWQPNDNLTVDFGFFHIDFTNVIVQQNAELLAIDGLIAGNTAIVGTPAEAALDSQIQVIVDGNTGQLLSVRNRYENAAFIETNGFDFSVVNVWDTDFGAFNLGVSGTYINNYKLPGIDGSVINGAGVRNRLNFADPVPEFRANVQFGWAYEDHAAQFFMRHVGSFTDDDNSVYGVLPNGAPDFNNLIREVEVAAFTTFDFNYRFDMSELIGVSNAAVTIGALNIFNQRPPAVIGDGGFETRTHDPRGRVIYGGLSFGF